MYTILELYDLQHSLAGEYLKQFTYPWEALGGIADLIRQLGRQEVHNFVDRVHLYLIFVA